MQQAAFSGEGTERAHSIATSSQWSVRRSSPGSPIYCGLLGSGGCQLCLAHAVISREKTVNKYPSENADAKSNSVQCCTRKNHIHPLCTPGASSTAGSLSSLPVGVAARLHQEDTQVASSWSSHCCTHKKGKGSPCSSCLSRRYAGLSLGLKSWSILSDPRCKECFCARKEARQIQFLKTAVIAFAYKTFK